VTYYYQVSAVNSLGEGGRSVERSAAPVAQLIATTPGAPTITAATGGDRQVSLTWSAPGSNGGSAITGYRVYRSTASGSETLLTTVGATAGYVDTTTRNNTTYYYKVTAINALGESAFSNERSATPRKHP
jgi:fibronectin type 3 domain-containing protein